MKFFKQSAGYLIGTLAVALATVMPLNAAGNSDPVGSQATAKHKVPFQARLHNEQNTPVKSDVYNLTLNLYTQETGGVSVWSEEHENVSVINGYVNLLLGSITPFNASGRNIDFSNQYYLGISIGKEDDNGDIVLSSELLPRHQLVPSYHAVSATDSAKLGGKDANDYYDKTEVNNHVQKEIGKYEKEIQVPVLDSEGNPKVDANGNPITEKGMALNAGFLGDIDEDYVYKSLKKLYKVNSNGEFVDSEDNPTTDPDNFVLKPESDRRQLIWEEGDDSIIETISDIQRIELDVPLKKGVYYFTVKVKIITPPRSAEQEFTSHDRFRTYRVELHDDSYWGQIKQPVETLVFGSPGHPLLLSQVEIQMMAHGAAGDNGVFFVTQEVRKIWHEDAGYLNFYGKAINLFQPARFIRIEYQP